VKKITATEAARGFADILNRVRYQGESYEVLRNGEAVARIVPAGPTRALTAGEITELIASLPQLDEGFEADVARIHRAGRLRMA
jgi:prevent-host-death family protein